MKYLISISYDGSKYNGLQKLKGKETVQGELEKVLSKMNESPVSVKAAGRTDKGVHAIDQKCHFELSKPITPFRLRYYIDRSTSKYLHIKDCTIIDNEEFHARFSVKSKTYIYKVNTGEYNPIMTDYIYNYNKPLNLMLMNDAKKALLGEHNYRAFVVGPQKTCDSEIYNIDIREENGIISIEVKGKSFYTYMVRYIVSALILVGAEKLQKCDITKMLETGKKVLEFSPAPACGLYLAEVNYD